MNRLRSMRMIGPPSEAGAPSEDGGGNAGHGAGASDVFDVASQVHPSVRIKTPKQIRVPKFPTVTQLQQWRRSIARELVASSAYNDKAEVKWFQKASAKCVKFEDLADVGDPRFASIDALPCSALIRTLPGDLHQRVRRKEYEAWQSETTV